MALQLTATRFVVCCQRAPQVSSGDVVETARLVANDGVRFSAERVVAVGEYVVRKRD